MTNSEKQPAEISRRELLGGGGAILFSALVASFSVPPAISAIPPRVEPAPHDGLGGKNSLDELRGRELERVSKFFEWLQRGEGGAAHFNRNLRIVEGRMTGNAKEFLQAFLVRVGSLLRVQILQEGTGLSWIAQTDLVTLMDREMSTYEPEEKNASSILSPDDRNDITLYLTTFSQAAQWYAAQDQH